MALDEDARLAVIEDYHRRTRAKLPNLRLHACIHAVVENQLAEGVVPVRQAIDRLLAEGLDRHNAIHAIGSVVTEHLWKAMNRQRTGLDPHDEYFRRVASLNATDWLREWQQPC